MYYLYFWEEIYFIQIYDAIIKIKTIIHLHLFLQWSHICLQWATSHCSPKCLAIIDRRQLQKTIHSWKIYQETYIEVRNRIRKQTLWNFWTLLWVLYSSKYKTGAFEITKTLYKKWPFLMRILHGNYVL